MMFLKQPCDEMLFKCFELYESHKQLQLKENFGLDLSPSNSNSHNWNLHISLDEFKGVKSEILLDYSLSITFGFNM